jgi:hypothetical protein
MNPSEATPEMIAAAQGGEAVSRKIAMACGKDFAARVRELRKAAGITEGDLIERLRDLSGPNGDWEFKKLVRGDWTGAHWSEMIRLADALGCKADDLVVYAEPKP